MNVSPEMMRMAQEQMARMTPEQLAEMRKMAAQMDPSIAAKMGVNPAQLRQASEAMQNMSPEDFAKASEQARPLPGPRAVRCRRTCAPGTEPPRRAQMKNMSPDDLKRQMEAVSSQSSAQQQYYFKVRTKRGDGLLLAP